MILWDAQPWRPLFLRQQAEQRRGTAALSVTELRTLGRGRDGRYGIMIIIIISGNNQRKEQLNSILLNHTSNNDNNSGF